MAVVLGVFVARPYLVGTRPLLTLFIVLLVVGLAWPVTDRAERAPAPGSAALSLAFGIGAFGVGRLLAGGHPPVPSRLGYLVALTLAAVAEEAFFRRFVYAVLRPGGAALAIAGSTVLFAIAHVTVYGWWVLPVDLGAGLILSWQRWSSGTWTVPAATHVIANLLVVL
ncbi:MAG: Type prenyl endopeptidase Rce1-like [Acidimicrobiaceae bacterium]|jgi:hypothetical protein|nr:Type prenyl endopeptidase Rce1-like [Acidimicrobiaceae bacterium]